MNSLTKKQTKLLIAVAAALFFVSSTVNHIFSGWENAVVFVITLLAILVLLTVILLLVERILKINREELICHKTEFEREKTELLEHNSKLKNKLEVLEREENRRRRNMLKEVELKKLVSKLADSSTGASRLLLYLVEKFQAMAAILYVRPQPEAVFTAEEMYGLPEGFLPAPFVEGEGLNGQAAKDGRAIEVQEIPDSYFNLFSGLGHAKPTCLYLLPVLKDEQCVALIELATFEQHDLAEVWENAVEKKNSVKQPSEQK